MLWVRRREAKAQASAPIPRGKEGTIYMWLVFGRAGLIATTRRIIESARTGWHSVGRVWFEAVPWRLRRLFSVAGTGLARDLALGLGLALHFTAARAGKIPNMLEATSNAERKGHHLVRRWARSV